MQNKNIRSCLRKDSQKTLATFHKFPSLNLNPAFFRFFIEFITCRTLGTLCVELPVVANNNVTPFKHGSKRGNGRGARGDTSLDVFLVHSNFQFILDLKGRPVLFLVFRSLGWCEPTEFISVTNAACTIYPNVTHIGLIFSPTNSERRWHSDFFLHDLGLALVAKTCPQRPRPSERPQMVRRFRRKHFLKHFFSERDDWRYSKACL